VALAQTNARCRDHMTSYSLLESYVLFGASAIVSTWMAITLIVHLRWNNESAAGLQNIHLERTSRLGGAALVIGYMVALGVGLRLHLIALFPALPLLIAALPVFVVGLWEDVAHRVPPRQRLLAALVSAALASVLAQGIVTRLDLPYVDGWLTYLPIAVPLTLFMVMGACNALNIIDGSHGLAGGTSILLFLGIAILAWNVGDRLVLVQAVGMICALASFLLWNYPRGKIFLGDAGAYFIGFMYAQLSIQLIAHNTGISAWSVTALAAYPIVETLYSMYRRKFVRHTAAMQPDVLHLHSLIYACLLRHGQRARPGDRRIDIWTSAYPGGERRRCIRGANARVAPLLWLHGGVCFASALYFHTNTVALIGFTCLYGLVYRLCYRSAVRISRNIGVSTMTSESNPSPALIHPPVQPAAQIEAAL